jgi:nucleoid-associated protein YgaU
MDTRVSNSTIRPLGNSVPVTAANNAAPAANATLNTTDAASFSANATAATSPASLEDIAAAIKEIESRLTSLEKAVATLQSAAPATNVSAANNGPANNTPVVNAPANNVPAANAPANNVPANNVPAANNEPAANEAGANGPVLPAGVNLPAFPGAANAPANSAAANNAPPANNTPAANEPATNAVANDPTVTDGKGTEEAAATAAPDSELEKLVKSLKTLQTAVKQQIADIDRLLRSKQPTADDTAERTRLDRQAAGLQAVSSVLKTAKLENLTPEEEKVIKPALKRVHEIGTAIGDGQNPNQFAGELFALKHTLADPSGAGTHKSVTAGAQVVDQINQQKGALETKLLAIKQQEAQGKLPAKVAAQKTELEGRYKALIGIEKALDGAKLTRLNPKGEARANEAIERLGALAAAIGSSKTNPTEMEDEIFRLGQTLKNPNGAPNTPAVQAGAEVVKQITDAKKDILKDLQKLDAKVIGGAAPEQFAGERQRLLDRAEALDELGKVVGTAKMEQTNAASKESVVNGLQQASTIAKALAAGESPSKFRAETFVLKQTFQEPIPSKDNAAVQAGAATLQVLGAAEDKNLKAQEAIAAKVAKGASPRKFDTELATLRRQHEDLEEMRHKLDGVDFGGLSAENEAKGAEIIDKMRVIAEKVGAGEDYAKHEKEYEALATELANLHLTAKPTPKPDPKPTPKPEPKPTEAGGPYAVKSGDFLTKIAREQLGNPERFKEIIELNKDKYPTLVKNPDLIYPGWTLILPKK